MPGTRDHHRADKETRLFESGEKRHGLRRRIDNVVMVAVDQKKPRKIPVDRGVTDRGSLEKDPAVCMRRHTKKFLRNIVAGSREQVVLPWRQHAENTVEADNRLDFRRYRGMGIGTIFAGER